VDLRNEYTGEVVRRVVDQVVVEYATVPNDDIYADLRAGSTNGGALDLDAFLAGEPQEGVVNPDGTYQLFRIGDAVASRNIHAAIYDARRLAMAL
jgi:hypothetical protein